MNKLLLISLAAALFAAGQGFAQSTPPQPYYQIDGDWITVHNGERFTNRPLYTEEPGGFVFAGDKPFLRLALSPHYVMGHFMAAVVRDGQGKWLQHCDDITTRFKPGLVQWEIRDAAFPGLAVRLEATTTAKGAGAAVKLSVEGAQEGDLIVWLYGGATRRVDAGVPNVAWELDPYGSPHLLTRDFVPEDCEGNLISVRRGSFTLTAPAYPAERDITPYKLSGWVGGGSVIRGDAAQWKEPAALQVEGESVLPAAAGEWAPEGADNTVHLIFQMTRTNMLEYLGAPETILQEGQERRDEPGRWRQDNAPFAFQAGQQRLAALLSRVEVDTPHDWFDVAVKHSIYATDGVWYPPVYVHGGVLWNIPFPGWRTLYGPTAYGRHENVKEQAAYYIASQVTEDQGLEAKASPALGLTQQAHDSRFHGQGRITQDTNFYNFQTQFFDMLVHAWRWTGDEKLEALLYLALRRHLEWQRECFDPDGDGVYESYINTWPTDSVWFNGGGGVEESSYAYSGLVALAEMARRAGDLPLAEEYEALARKIPAAVKESLWIPEHGYFAAYRDQLGLQRRHDDAWLYSIFTPIATGMISAEEAVQALHYTEWGLEREQVPFGGERCWGSNWVPAVWSVRTLYPGDNFHLALAYSQAGLPEDAWKLIEGNVKDVTYNSAVPGTLGVKIGGTDFSDLTSMFGRYVVEGLFGYQPDYPNGAVTCAPRFPPDWEHARIDTPDYGVDFKRSSGQDLYRFQLAKEADARFSILVPAERVTGVRVNGQRAEYSVTPGYGALLVTVEQAACAEAEIAITWEGALSPPKPQQFASRVGAKVMLRGQLGGIADFSDPQGILHDVKLSDGELSASMAQAPGNHLVFLKTESEGRQARWERVALEVLDPAAEAAQARLTRRAPAQDAQWQPVDMTQQINGDIRTIFQQEYLSPRPETTSVRLGTNGYGAWTFYYWGMQPPPIYLDETEGMLQDGRLVTPQGVPFRPLDEERNIAFTSRWDNWPEQVEVPVGERGKAIWFLVCGSTFPMQTCIANAVLRIHYADGETDALELVPPLNFWSLCAYGGLDRGKEESVGGGVSATQGLHDAVDYDYETDAFVLPEEPPLTVQLGHNCRAILLGRTLRDVEVERISLECLSQDVVIGLMGVTVEQ